MKQFHLQKHIFDDLAADADGSLNTHGEGWVRVETQEQINAVCASITAGGCVWLEKGELKTSGARPSPAHVWDEVKKAWKEDAARKREIAAALLAEAKAVKLAELNVAAQQFIRTAAQLDAVPDFEIATWSIQAAEAEAWAADKTAPTPTLDGIAAARGIPAEALKQKALEKARAYSALTAAVAGQRQALAAQIEAAGDVATLAAVDVSFRLPESAVQS